MAHTRQPKTINRETRPPQTGPDPFVLPSPDLLQDLLDNLFESAFAIDTEYRYLAFNREHAIRMFMLYGVTIEIGRSVLDYMTVVQDRERLQSNLDAVLSAGEKSDEGPTGAQEISMWYFKARFAPISVEGGQVLGVLVTSQDISGLMETQQALSSSEELFRVSFTHMLVGMALVGANGRFRSVNPALCRMLGYNEAELTSLTFNDITHPEDRTPGNNFVEQALAGRVDTTRFEKRYIKKNGQDIWVDVSSTAFRDQLGGFQYFVTAVNEITDLKLAQAVLLDHQQQLEGLVRQRTDELASSEARFRNLFENLSSVILVIDTQTGAILDANQQASQFYGYSLAELTSKNMLDLGVLSKDETCQLLEETLAQGHTSLTLKQRLAGGGLREVEVFPGPIQLDGREAVQAVIHDITERRQYESGIADALQFNQTILQSSPIGISVFNAAGDCISANAAAGQILDADPSFLLTQNFHRIEAWRQSEMYGAALHTLKTSEPFSLHVHTTSSLGRELWLNTTLATFTSGGQLHLMVMFEDDSDRQKAEAQLELSNQKMGALVLSLEQGKRNSDLLRQMSELLQVCRDQTEAAAVVEQFGVKFFPGSSGALYLLAGDLPRMNAAAIWGRDMQSPAQFPRDDCWALRRGQAHFVAAGQPALKCRHMDKFFGGSYYDLPLGASGEPFGMLHIEYADNPSEALNEDLARSLAENLSLSLANIKLRQTLEYQSVRDPLTGAFNRRYMEETLQRELTRAMRRHSPICILMLDIDLFKQFNDTFGHAAGDLVLTRLSALLQTHVRGEDVVCRLGGEEFVLILPDTSQEVGLQRAEAIRAACGTQRLEYKARPLGTVNISVGVAVFPQHGHTGDDLLEASDKALYRAKRQGRNRVELAE